MLRTAFSLGSALTLLSLSVPTAFAQDAAGDEAAAPTPGETAAEAEPPPAEGPAPAGDPDSVALSDQQALLEEEQGVSGAEQPRESTDPYEDPHETYLFVGAFYEHTWTPSAFIELFTDRAPSANNHGAGLELTARKDGMSIIGRLYWQGGFADGAFRGSGDPLTDTEIVHSDLWAVMGSATFLWSTAFNDMFALEYGIGVGVGGVGGKLERWEAYRDGDDWEQCDGPGDPPSGAYCEPSVAGDGTKGGHYGHEPDNWFNGGSIPALFFRLDLPHLALRFKPIAQLMMRLDFGFQVPLGPFVGFTMAYGI